MVGVFEQFKVLEIRMMNKNSVNLVLTPFAHLSEGTGDESKRIGLSSVSYF